MKIYAGKNKKLATEISLKNLLISILEKSILKLEVEGDRFSDGSADWLSLRKTNSKGCVDVVINFNIDDCNVIEGIDVWQTKFVLDEENMKQII